MVFVLRALSAALKPARTGALSARPGEGRWVLERIVASVGPGALRAGVEKTGGGRAGGAFLLGFSGEIFFGLFDEGVARA